MSKFVEALDAISTQVWAVLLILVGAGLLLTHVGSAPGKSLLEAGLLIFQVPKTDKGTGEKTQ